LAIQRPSGAVRRERDFGAHDPPWRNRGKEVQRKFRGMQGHRIWNQTSAPGGRGRTRAGVDVREEVTHFEVLLDQTFTDRRAWLRAGRLYKASIMESPTRPLFALYVIWHPSFVGGREIADRFREHFGGNLYRAVSGERGVSVLYRSESIPGASVPLPIDWNAADVTAAVVLAESSLIDDQEWGNYIRDLSKAARKIDSPANFFPVTIDSRGIEFGFDEQALRWDLWDVPDTERWQRLDSVLTHEFCRMLRHHLDPLQQPSDSKVPHEQYLEKIQVFLSHSKHDEDGEAIARGIREWMHNNSTLSSFFDVHDIPPGMLSGEILLQQIAISGAIIAVHTDSYSSREWCRREVIEAKRCMVPMIVVDCVRDADPCGIPYLGNVPIIRMDPDRADRIRTVEGYLLDEVFRTWLWHCRIERFAEESPGVLFSVRPPELIALTALPGGREESGSAIVYPEPLLGADEARLFSEIAPQVRVRTLKEWLEERP